MNDSYDVVISGAGTAGLSTAIFCANNGRKVLVLEKHSQTAAFPRGETARPDPVIDDLLGPGFMGAISVNRTAKRRYWCPGSSRSFSIERDSASYLFHLKDLTEGLKNAAEIKGVEIRFNSEVTGPVVEKGRCMGVRLNDGSQCCARTTVAADGHTSHLGKSCGVNYDALNNPIAKRIYTGVDQGYDGMEFFFIAPGTLPHAPDFPPSIAFIFPRGNGEAEVGLLLLSGTRPRKQKKIQPDSESILHVFQKVSESYPVFSDRLRKADIAFEGVTFVPMEGLFPSTSVIPGLVMCGDTIGLVEATGGSGIVASMKQGAFIADFLETHHPPQWSPWLMETINESLRNSTLFKEINKKQRLILPLRRLMFRKKRPAYQFELAWDLIGLIYKKI